MYQKKNLFESILSQRELKALFCLHLHNRATLYNIKSPLRVSHINNWQHSTPAFGKFHFIPRKVDR